MEIKMNNMLEVVELISALEARIEFCKEYFPTHDLTLTAIMNIYNQVKEDYKGFLNFKYQKIFRIASKTGAILFFAFDMVNFTKKQ